MEVLVIGAGVIGLACARAIARSGHSVIIADREAGIGSGVSSRNSEVIHAGLYYPTGSLRARHCVRGRELLYEYCESHGVPAKRCGKLVVATSELELAKIEGIYQQGLANGVDGLSLIEADRAKTLEPNLSCIAALLSEETGIVDSHALMLALQGDVEDASGNLALNAEITRLSHTALGWEVEYRGADSGSMTVDAVVNAAGLGAQALARATDGYPPDRIPPLVYAKGNYFGCLGKPAFRRLIYPAPVDGGLGTHLTLDLAGRMRFGPDVEWVDRLDYEVRPERAGSFYASIRRYWPGLPDGALVPDYAGIRPKLTGPGEKPADFVVEGPEEHGLPRLVALFGIESPGLTSALSLALDVCARIGE
ncbi:NAD(P)/FAD-dependent oxidoreductase [Enterovirga aerilata]|uniref:NAD(P)/FAD-dependent oxidoreductase n=1 Tax=Enterovirga aerilata TaxID=2730920 RepID=A0A849I567_9HYPH|nr:NAD(P)/FAD-dependent oxidoreductase [Enterovirga sp. DB1703]NNM71197.1 NAD(P)/FAD-dependent oxidoreductase [Enterovirga sp. DB1703]